jgi:hypothetical protein
MTIDSKQLDKFLNGFSDFIDNLSDEEWENLNDDNVQDFYEKCGDELNND